jgi:hypothetical protein
MFNQISYNVIIERFKVFASGHYLIRRFSHGQIDVTDLEKEQEFPWMHVVPVSLRADPGARVFTFDVIFADIPRDKETNTDYQKENISDCIRLAEDLLAEIANGLVVFGPDVELEAGSTITPFIQEYTHTLSGATLALTISVPNNYDACAIPADWSIGGSGSGQPPSPPVSLVLKVNNVDNVNQNVLDLVNGTNVTIEDLGDGRVRINSSGGGGGSVAWGAITGTLSNQTDLQTALNLKADISSLGAAAFSNDYNDLDNLPTIPAAQVNSDWNAVAGVAQILNRPTLQAVATSGDYNDLVNTPTIPNGLQDVITLDPVLTTDNTIDCGTHALTFDNTTNFIVNSTSKLSVNVNGTAELSIDSQSVGMVENSGAVQSTVIVDTVKAGMQSTNAGDSTSLTIAPTSVKLITPNVNDATAIVGQVLTLTNAGSGEVEFQTVPAASVAWGDITGTLSDQTDLQTALDAKMTTAVYDTDVDGVVDAAETVQITVRNSTGSTLLKGQVVYLSGATGNRPNALLADATLEATSSKTIGFVIENIANNADGQVAVNGTLHDLDTSSFAAGDTLWLSETAGAWQANTPPAEPAHAVFLGYVARSHPTLGRVVIAIQNGYELNELHGVLITSEANNDALMYDGATSLWKNRQLVAADLSDSTTVGRNLLTLPNPSAVRYLRLNADNTITALTLAQIKTDLSISSAIMTAAYTNVGTGFESLTELFFAVSANKTYKWRATLTYTATAGITFSLTGPASPTFNNYRFTASNAATTNTVFNALAYDAGTNAAASNNGLCTADGIIRPTANGTVTVRIRCATAGAMTVRAGSIIEYEEVL